jgi:hypothetical protein
MWQHSLGIVASASLMVVSPLAIGYAQTAPTVVPEPVKIFQQMGEFLSQQKAFSFQADVTNDDVRSSGQKIQFGTQAAFVVVRPNKFYADYKGDRRQASFYYDGTSFTMQDNNKNLYATIPASSDIDTLINNLQDQYDLTLPMGDLISTDTFTNILDKVASKASSISYIGTGAIDGVACHHLAFSQKNLDWQIWIRVEAPPLPCKFVITYKNEPGSPQYTAVLSNWDFSTRSPDDAKFTFTPPANAVKIEFLPNRTAQVKDKVTPGANP